MPGKQKTRDSKELSPFCLGQHCPRHCPPRTVAAGGKQVAPQRPALGAPMNIREVAAFIGCSPWSVRNTWIPKGLPHFRFGASSKLIFYTDQVVRWIERQQQGGERH